jgi:hypothetical protein
MRKQSETSRRTVLKTIGAGVVSGTILSGSAGAKKGDKGSKSGRSNNYGNGNGIGAFLNEEAKNKPSPVWDTGVADKTG